MTNSIGPPPRWSKVNLLALIRSQSPQLFGRCMPEATAASRARAPDGRWWSYSAWPSTSSVHGPARQLARSVRARVVRCSLVLGLERSQAISTGMCYAAARLVGGHIQASRDSLEASPLRSANSDGLRPCASSSARTRRTAKAVQVRALPGTYSETPAGPEKADLARPCLRPEQAGTAKSDDLASTSSAALIR